MDMNRKQTKDAQTFDPAETKKLQKGPTNFHVLGCLSNLKDDTENAVKNNAGLWTTVVALGGGIAATVVCFAFSLKIFTAKVFKKLTVSDGFFGCNIGYRSPYVFNDAAPKSGGNGNGNGNNNDGKKDNISEISNPPKKDIISNSDSEDGAAGDKNKKDINNNMIGNLSDNEEGDEEVDSKTKRDKLALKDENNNLYKRDITEVGKVYEEKRGIKNVAYRIEEEKDIYNLDDGLFLSMRKENVFLRAPYEYSRLKDKSSYILMTFTEIFEKIHFSKTFFLYRKYDLISALICLYLLYHVLVLTICAIWFNVDTIKKIYNETDFPDKNYYIVHGFITFAIVWVIYSLLLYLIRFDKPVNDLVEFNNNNKIQGIPTRQSQIDAKFKDCKKKILIRLIVFFIIAILLMIFGFLYITTFCAVFPATKTYLFVAYGVTLLIFLVIKIGYGFLLGTFRYISLKAKAKVLFNIVRFFEVYIS